MDIYSAFDVFVGKNGNVILWILFLIFIAFLTRELALWYWKINRIIELLENIETNTRKENSVNAKEKEVDLKM